MRRLLLAAILCSISTVALAEPVPQPSVDYVAKGTMGGRGSLTVRHHAGKVRTDMMMDGLPIAVLMIFDLKAQKGLIQMPGMKGAMEVDLNQAGGLGQIAGQGVKDGTAKVAGETCDLWQMVSRRANALTACITPDGIHLLTQITVNGAKKTLMEMTEVSRTPQDPALFQLPPGTPVVKAPNGPPAGFLGR